MTPITDVTLFKSKLDISNKCVVYVQDGADARNQVISLSTKFLYLNSCYWQRDDFVIRAPYNIDSLRDYNYCSYKNTTTGKYIYAFITDLNYINDDLTYINIVTDAWMTYSHECTFGYSLMDRCHPEADEESDGSNYFTESISPILTPEFSRIDIGDDESEDRIYVTSQVGLTSLALKIPSYPDAYTEWIKYCSTPLEGDAEPFYAWWDELDSQGIIIGGIPQKPTAGFDASAESIESITKFLKGLAECNLESLIVSSYVVPAGFAPTQSGDLTGTFDFLDKDNLSTDLTWSDPVNWKKIYYAPQFNKLSYRFCGNSIEIPFERLNIANLRSGSQHLLFAMTSNWSEDGCAFIRPIIEGGAEFVISSPQWDKISFSVFTGSSLRSLTDQYNNNLKRVQRVLGLVGSAIGLGAGMNAVSSGVGDILGEKSAAYFAENNFLPTAAGPFGSNAVNQSARMAGRAAGAVGAAALAFKQLSPLNAAELPSSASVVGTTATSLMGLLSSQPALSVTHEYPHGDSMKKLNDFFSTWGYDQGGLLHVVNTDPGALKWKYYKTIDCNISGDCAQNYISTIKDMFDSGIFIFKDAAAYKDFSAVDSNHY